MIDNKIVLFDMDGTLTEPRGKFNTEFLILFREIIKYADIGILTGADFSDVENQLLRLIKFSEIRFKLHLLPCNGTKYYKPPKYPQEDFEIAYENDMQKELGKSCLREIFKSVTQLQADSCYYDIPLSGHFVNYRGSMINWCPIGRGADSVDRKAFIKYDKKSKFREKFLSNLQSKISLRCPNRVDVKLGGQTSFDIFPIGWDKTYALNHFENYKHWFVGDACHIGGNDHEIYELLKKENRAFHTKGPTDTQRIIHKKILPMLRHS